MAAHRAGEGVKAVAHGRDKGQLRAEKEKGLWVVACRKGEGGNQMALRREGGAEKGARAALHEEVGARELYRMGKMW
jgi:hypothetical protein